MRKAELLEKGELSLKSPEFEYRINILCGKISNKNILLYVTLK